MRSEQTQPRRHHHVQAYRVTPHWLRSRVQRCKTDSYLTILPRLNDTQSKKDAAVAFALAGFVLHAASAERFAACALPCNCGSCAHAPPYRSAGRLLDRARCVVKSVVLCCLMGRMARGHQARLTCVRLWLSSQLCPLFETSARATRRQRGPRNAAARAGDVSCMSASRHFARVV